MSTCTGPEKTTVNKIIGLYGQEYIRSYNPGDYKIKILRAIMDCRTEIMGGRKEVCDYCGHVVTLYNSCRNRHCPLCQFIKKEKWVLEKQDEILPFQYFHVVFTLPHSLNPIINRNRRIMYKLLFDKAKETLLSVAGQEKYFGAKIGYFSILHTWGQKLNQHYHLHCAVPGGGYSEKKQKWLACPKDYFVPIDVLKARFRRLFMDALFLMFKNNELNLTGSGFEDKREFLKLKDQFFRTEWVVYLKEAFKNSQSVIKYLAKYTHRIAISNHRIIKLENGKVYFKYRDYKDKNKEKIEVLTALEFIHKFLNHIVPYRFVRIRYYGLMSHRNKKKAIEECRTFFDIKIKAAHIPCSWQEYLFLIKGLDVFSCSYCGKGKMHSMSIPKKLKRAPPENIKKGIKIFCE